MAEKYLIALDKGLSNYSIVNTLESLARSGISSRKPDRERVAIQDNYTESGLVIKYYEVMKI